MCFCDSHFFTINRGDFFMVAELEPYDDDREGISLLFSKSRDWVPPMYILVPPTVMKLVEIGIEGGRVELQPVGNEGMFRVVVDGVVDIG